MSHAISGRRVGEIPRDSIPRRPSKKAPPYQSGLLRRIESSVTERVRNIPLVGRVINYASQNKKTWLTILVMLSMGWVITNMARSLYASDTDHHPIQTDPLFDQNALEREQQVVTDVSNILLQRVSPISREKCKEMMTSLAAFVVSLSRIRQFANTRLTQLSYEGLLSISETQDSGGWYIEKVNSQYPSYVQQDPLNIQCVPTTLVDTNMLDVFVNSAHQLIAKSIAQPQHSGAQADRLIQYLDVIFDFLSQFVEKDAPKSEVCRDSLIYPFLSKVTEFIQRFPQSDLSVRLAGRLAASGAAEHCSNIALLLEQEEVQKMVLRSQSTNRA